MLFKQAQLYGIKSGLVSLAFRKWKSARVRKGSLIKTSVGQIEILSITEIERGDISNEEAKSSGSKNLNELLNILDTRAQGQIFRIEVKYHSPDPRIKLRQDIDINSEEINAIKRKLDQMNRFSKYGDWTFATLKLIASNPQLKAQFLAAQLGFEKAWLKLNIRKLKALGLTESHKVGYSISPRGRIILKNLNSQ